jgi:hypothetical protein
VTDPKLTLSFRNLLSEYGDCLLPSEQGLLLLLALGGTDVPVDLLKSVKIPMRRWTDGGEIQSISAVDFGFSSDLVTLLSNDDVLSQVGQRPEVTRQTLEDGTVILSLHSQAKDEIANRLSPQTVEDWETTALQLLCFACPPCYEGKVNWYVHPSTQPSLIT